MKENADANAGGPRGHGPAVQPATGPNGHAHNGTSRPPIDIWVALDILGRRWHWLFLGACLFAGGFFYLGYQFIKPKFTAVAQMKRTRPPILNEALKSPEMTPETFTGLIRSPELLTKVGNQADPPIPPERLTKMIKIDPEADSEFVKVLLASDHPQKAVDLLNTYVREAADFLKEIQKGEIARLANDNLSKQITRLTNELAAVQEQFVHTAAPVAVSNKLSEIRTVVVDVERLQKAKEELATLLQKFTEIHPAVEAKRQEIADIKARVDQSTNQPPSTAGSLADALLNAHSPSSGASAVSSAERDMIHIRLMSLEEAKTRLITIQTEADGILANPSGYAEVWAPANMKTVQRSLQEVKIGAATVFGGLVGIGLTLVLVLLVEVTDNRLLNADDVRRVTKLPILTTLGDLEKMKQPERAQWAFRTWTILQGRLSPTANHGLVCGITSSGPGEGRSTWIHMLAEAASLTGFRVLTISTRPTALGDGSEEHEQLSDLDPETEARSDDPYAYHEFPRDAEDGDGKYPDAPSESNDVAPATANGTHGANGTNGTKSSSALANSVLSAPSQVTEQFSGPNSQPMVHIPLPGWVWNLERRKQWRDALTQWRSIENLVILVELPPASVPEAVLLGSNLPNLLWLTESGKADASETRTQLDILRHARCNLVGAVVNREGTIPFRKRFPKWVEAFSTFLVVSGFALNLTAQNTPVRSPQNQLELAAAAAPAATEEIGRAT